MNSRVRHEKVYSVNQLFTEPYMPCQSRSDFVSTLLNKSNFISLVSLQEHASWRTEISWMLFADISRLYLSFFIDIFIVFFHSIVDTTSNGKHLHISLFFLFKEKQKKVYLINTTLLIQNLNIARKLLILQVDSITYKMCIILNFIILYEICVFRIFFIMIICSIWRKCNEMYLHSAVKKERIQSKRIHSLLT